ncbi:alpha/beta hydrolase [Streptomyces sp. CA-251387]|uniref:alpha/beta hydrolase n=1 Tax=Streptomyces sp. CA-251387 TaxID=3240064 RepID=UPI003D8D58F7
MREAPSADVRSRTGAMSPGVRSIALDGAGVTLSGLFAEPAHGAPRAVVAALHGGGMRAGYFDSRVHPDLSLLTLGARLGFTVLALDRPGYGLSATRLPDGQTLTDQVVTVSSALAAFAERHPTGAGVLLLGHSFGGKLALRLAAEDAVADLLAVDVSGCGHRFAVDPDTVHQRPGMSQVRLNWGPLSLYPPGTFEAAGALAGALPRLEAKDARDWPRMCDALLPRIKVPVRLTFAEHEAWWRQTDDDLADLAALLSAAPCARVERLPDAGHNISLGRTARAYHLRVLAFLEETLHTDGRRAARPA